ncbi:MAG TPA: MFS transporter [Planctomycetota bacterium]|jgi:ACS family tartrate transporter-like MFS transporter
MEQLAPDVQQETMRRITWRLIPFMMLLYFVAFLDRANVGFAAKSMNEDLGISKTLYGFGAGAFFLGYFLFEVPSNLLLHRFGARRWIARIMISWGIVSAATALVVGANSYISIRILLGIAEAGFFPGMILYLTYWFPGSMRGRITALFVAAIPISGIIGAPLSGALLDLSGTHGLKGWQWMFIVEAIPAILIGATVPFLLTDRPAQARWLKPEQAQWLQGVLDRESSHKPHMPLLQALLHPSILVLSGVYFCMMVGLYGLNFWMPTVLDATGLSSSQMKWVPAIPPACGAIVMFFWGRHSDQKSEREWHVAAALVVGAVGLGLTGLSISNLPQEATARGLTPVSVQVMATTGFVLLAIGVFSAMASFWPLPSARLVGTAAAGGIAVINSIGNLGGFIGPYTIGALKDTHFGYTGGLIATALTMAVGAVLVVATKASPAPQAAPQLQ